MFHLFVILQTFTTYYKFKTTCRSTLLLAQLLGSWGGREENAELLVGILVEGPLNELFQTWKPMDA